MTFSKESTLLLEKREKSHPEQQVLPITGSLESSYGTVDQFTQTSGMEQLPN
jgi:hypothetical protein